MTDREIIKELNTLKKQVYGMQAAMNRYFEEAHAESQKNISVLENTIVDNEIQLAELQNKVGE